MCIYFVLVRRDALKSLLVRGDEDEVGTHIRIPY